MEMENPFAGAKVKMSQAARLNLRMQKELKYLLSDPPPGASFPLLSSGSEASSSALTNIDAHLEGPEGTVYGGGIFKINIQIPDRYPFQPPSVTFATPIYHPNIDTGGRICLDILTLPPKGAWQPSLNVSTVLTSIRLLLSDPNPDDGLMGDASSEYKYNKQAFDQKARAMTEKYAKIGTGVLTGTDESIQHKESKRAAEHSVPEPGAHVVGPHIKLALPNQRISTEFALGTMDKNGHGDSCDYLSNFDFLPEPKNKLEAEKIKKKSETVTNVHAWNCCQTSRKLCLDSLSQAGKANLHCKSGDLHNIQSNNQAIRSVSTKTSVLQVDERLEQYHEYHEYQDNRVPAIGSTRMSQDKKQPVEHVDTFRMSDDVHRKILATHGLTPIDNHCTAFHQIPMKSFTVEHIKHHNQEIPMKRLENGSPGQSSKKHCPLSKKLSLGSKYASQMHATDNKENLMAIHLKLPLESQKNVLTSNVCSTASQVGENQETLLNNDSLDVSRHRKVAYMKPSQGPLAILQCVNDGNVQLLSNPEIVAENPSQSGALDQIYVPNKKPCPSKKVSNDWSNEQGSTVNSPLKDEVIVLDSEDSEDESIHCLRPRLLVGRKTSRKWK